MATALRNDPQTAPAIAVIRILTAAGWQPDDILNLALTPHALRDRLYETDQQIAYGEVRITAAAMRAEIRRLLT